MRWRCLLSFTPLSVFWIMTAFSVRRSDALSTLSVGSVSAAVDKDSGTVGESLLVVEPSPCALELERFAASASKKVPGSYPSLKLWRSWSQLAIEKVRNQLEVSLPHPVDEEATSDLSFQLGVAADVGSMPCFGHPGGRAGYALDFFCRAKMLSDLLFEATEASVAALANGAGTGGEDGQAFFCSALKEMGLSSSLRRVAKEGDASLAISPIKLTSLGGGPGYDFVAAALASSYHYSSQQQQQHIQHEAEYSHGTTISRATPIHATVFDYEEGWKDLVSSMSNSVQSCLPQGDVHRCEFGGACDITLPLSDPVNRRCREQVSSTDLWICCYCVAENANKLRESNYVFFQKLFSDAREGSLFLFTETTHRLWPEIAEIALKGNVNGRFHIAFPRVGRGKGNSQLVLQKATGEGVMSEEQRILCDKFRRDAVMHERKIASGFQRQTKKVRGAK